MSRLTDYIFGASTVVLMSISALPAKADAQAFLGEVMPFALGFCPSGWLRADGSLLLIQRHQSLFALIGNMYGGDGVTNFALPGLSGRVPLHHGASRTLPSVTQGTQTQEILVAEKSEAGLEVSPALGITYCININGSWPVRP